MSGLDIRRFLNNFNQNYTQSKTFTARGTLNAFDTASSLQKSSQPALTNSVQSAASQTARQVEQNVQMNTLQSIDRAIYAKDLMQIPKNINEFIYILQKGLTQQQFNQMFANQLAAQRNTLSQLQAQILAQLQGLNIPNAKEMVNAQLCAQFQSSLKNLEILANGMINLSDISVLLQKNGKEALTKLIMSMTEASKSGVTDLTQMKEMAKLINACISIAGENNPPKTLKLLLMLYLPWLPLEDGVGFDLEINSDEEKSESGDSILTVTLTTVNFGTVVATLVLETSNSVQISIECSQEFPKDELLLRIESDRKHYSMDTVTTFSVNKGFKAKTDKPRANVNMSQTNQINPYLLLCAHTIIKHVIDIDNNTSPGGLSDVDNSE